MQPNTKSERVESWSLVKPKSPNSNAHVRVVSLSSCVPALCPRRFERGCDNLRALGFRVSQGEFSRAKYHHMAGTPEQRAQDLITAWFDPEVDIILSSIGGSSTAQILEYLPFEKMRQNPKVLVGYSDTTTLMLSLYARSGLVSFHGPALMPQFGEFGGLSVFALESFRLALNPTAEQMALPQASGHIEEHLRWETEDNRSRELAPSRTRRCIREGTAEGPVIVANMGCLLSLVGTPYLPRFDGSILVLEDDESETPDSLDRYFTQLRQSGVLAQAAGLVVGRFPKKVGLSNAALDDMVNRAMRGTDVPILVGFEVGHVDPALTVPIGIRGRLDSTQLSLLLLEPGAVA